MLDYARPYDHPNMHDMYLSTAPAPARLETFQVFKKGNAPYIYGNYYNNFDVYTDSEIDAGNVYHNLVAREYPREDWKWNSKMVMDWTTEDTMTWVNECAVSQGFSECDVPLYNFKVYGAELRGMRMEEVVQRMSHPQVNPDLSRSLGETVFNKLQQRLSEESVIKPGSMLRYGDDPYQRHESAHTMLDLDSLDNKNRFPSDYKLNNMSLLPPVCDSSDDAEDFRLSEAASPDCPYGSDGSKSGDEEEKRKMFKRPPGRPKGSGRKVSKRPRSVSVPEFLRNLLLDPNHCPSIIRWENHSEGKFRFVKPDEVAKLWGQMKQNDNMTFEKFSRAMRYHYRQAVLVSVPSHRLVYQFGHKGPNFQTDNPNFEHSKIKSESNMTYS